MNPRLLVIFVRLLGGYLGLVLLRLFHSTGIRGSVSDFHWHDENERKGWAEFSSQKMWS